MRGLLEDIAFFPWIRELTARKKASDLGGLACLGNLGGSRGGCRWSYDIGTARQRRCTLWRKEARFKRNCFQEVFGIDERQTVAEIVQELDEKVGAPSV